MHVEVFSLCDAATEYAGKLNILGAFDTLWAKEVPVVHPQCAIALRVRFSRAEQGEHKIVIDFVDLDGRHLIPPAEGTIKIQFADDRISAAVNFVFHLQQLKLDRYGEYSIRLIVDGREEAALPLFFKKRE